MKLLIISFFITDLIQCFAQKTTIFPLQSVAQIADNKPVQVETPNLAGAHEYYYYDDDEYYYNYYGTPYFEIRSFIRNSVHYNEWCLQEAISQKKGKKNSFIAGLCDGSPSQKWFLDYKGLLHNQNYPEKCVKRSGRWLQIEDCSKETIAMKWIYSTDGTIRFGGQALFAISIQSKYTKGSWSRKKIAQLTISKVANRLPKINEQWMIIFDEESYYPPTFSPTMEQTDDDYLFPSIAPAPGKPTSNGGGPTITPLPPKGKFNIALQNMGKDTRFDESFQQAKEKFEKIVIGDLPDQQAMPSGHDWLAGYWPGNPVNGFIDDVLIGYEITDIDGLDGTLGYAGPIYIRHEGNSITTISGIMKFDKVDFKTMSKSDINLIVLHEMAHVLGLGTLWSSYKCGTKCNPATPGSGNTTVAGDTYKYDCIGASDEYAKMVVDVKKPKLMIASNDCAHWSEKSFENEYSSELMTPFFEEKKYQPFTRVSIASLADLGYKVNMTAADPLLLHLKSNKTDDGKGPTTHGLKRNLMDEEFLVDHPKPSKTFVLDDSNMKRPEVHIIDQLE